MTCRSSAVWAWLEASNCSSCIREVTEYSFVTVGCYYVTLLTPRKVHPTQPNATPTGRVDIRTFKARRRCAGYRVTWSTSAAVKLYEAEVDKCSSASRFTSQRALTIHSCIFIILYYAIWGGTKVKNTKDKYTIKHTKTENYKIDSKRTLYTAIYTQQKKNKKNAHAFRMTHIGIVDSTVLCSGLAVCLWRGRL